MEHEDKERLLSVIVRALDDEDEATRGKDVVARKAANILNVRGGCIYIL
jgi:hypothetical protein